MVFPREPTAFTRYGGWIPSDERVYRGFHSRLADLARGRRKSESVHNEAVQAFADAINKPGPEGEISLMRTLFDKIFRQAAKKYNFYTASSLLQLRQIQR